MNKGTTIFIPVYNEAQRIEKAIRCAAPQCEHLLISDNASSDGTEAICRGLQTEFPNIQFFRQKENIGALNNWLYLLKRVDTPFVMALGSHDAIDDDYVNRLQSVLESDCDTELAVGEVYFERNNEITPYDDFNDWRGGAQEDARARVNACIFDRINLGWTAYGLFRTKTSKRILLAKNNPIYGIDIIQLAKIAEAGKIRVVHGTRYYAWIRDTNKKNSSYLERLLGKGKPRRVTLEMRNDFRRALFESYTTINQWSSARALLAARYRFMVRIGVFKIPGPDYGFYLLYLPVKLARKMVRGF